MRRDLTRISRLEVQDSENDLMILIDFFFFYTFTRQSLNLYKELKLKCLYVISK